MSDALRLQSRVEAAFRDSPEERELPAFSDYAQSAFDLTQKLMVAARDGGVEAALDEFDRLRASENLGRLRRALMEFLTHDPRAAKAGLRIPPWETRVRP